MVIIMNLFVLMVILSPFTAVIPGIYGIYLIYKKKAKVLKNYLTIGLILLFLCFLFSGVINKSIISIAFNKDIGIKQLLKNHKSIKKIS